MKRGNQVRVLDSGPFYGMIGTITKVYAKETWDDPDCPEYEVNLGVIEDSEYNEVDATALWFNASELELV